MNRKLRSYTSSRVALLAVILICSCSYKHEDSFVKLFSKYDLASAQHGTYYSIDGSPLFAELDSGKTMLYGDKGFYKVLPRDVERDISVVVVAGKDGNWGELSDFINNLRSKKLNSFFLPVTTPSNPSYGGQWIPLNYTQEPIEQRIVISGAENELQVSLYDGDVLEHQLNKQDVSKLELYTYLIRNIKKPNSDMGTSEQVVVSISDEVKLGEFVYVYDYILMASLSANFEVFVD